MSQVYGQNFEEDAIGPLIDPKQPWARLFKKRSIYSGERPKTLYEGQEKDYFDICGTQFSFGREHSCQYVIGKDSGLEHKYWQRISKVHFSLYKDKISNEEHIFIKDLSRNGTYLNEELIGKNQIRMLKDEDVISVVDSSLKVFTVRDLLPRQRNDVPKGVAEKFILGQKLGSGAFGDVFKIFDRKSNTYAVKIIKHNSLTSMPNENVSENEIKIMREVNHVCIIKTIDMVKNTWYTYLVLEYMGGGDLLSAILAVQNHGLGIEQSRCIFYQITKAVEYLHGIGITHRDIKPDNVLLKDYDEFTLVKLTDFGLSKLVGQGSYMKTLIGTPSYTAPEVIRTDVLTYTSKIDIWSMGVTLFAMLSATYPFAEEYGDVNEQVLSGTFKFIGSCWKQVSQSGLRLIKKMLTVDPDKRIDASAILKTPWMYSKHLGIENAKKIMKKYGESAPPTRIENNLKRVHIENEEDNLPPAKRARPNA